MMDNNEVNAFNDYRSKMNAVILGKENLVIKRLFNLDTQTYIEGALDVKTKEMLGLVASMVLRCDDCIKYHLLKCRRNNCYSTYKARCRVLGSAQCLDQNKLKSAFIKVFLDCLIDLFLVYIPNTRTFPRIKRLKIVSVF
jgi:alkylhydroperoxidase/carboxymuconolactone decarboxylase family protein YurZ